MVSLPSRYKNIMQISTLHRAVLYKFVVVIYKLLSSKGGVPPFGWSSNEAGIFNLHKIEIKSRPLITPAMEYFDTKVFINKIQCLWHIAYSTGEKQATASTVLQIWLMNAPVSSDMANPLSLLVGCATDQPLHVMPLAPAEISLYVAVVAVPRSNFAWT